jgi:hypothetical protein
MCIITQTVYDVSKTRIYTALNKTGTHQVLVYQNFVDTPSKSNTMILPVPNPDSLVFINMEEYPGFFDDCQRCFRQRRDHEYLMRSCALSSSYTDTLPVYRLGSYNLSVAKTWQDLDRVNRDMYSFPEDLTELLRRKYDSHFGFLVCRLRQGAHNYHPLAYIHEKDPCRLLFVPTFHYHVHSHSHTVDADWDHTIYSSGTDLDSTWEDKLVCETTRPVKWQVFPQDFWYSAAKPMNRWTKYGDWTNKDLWLSPKD